MCKNAVEKKPYMLQVFPHQYKTLQICKNKVGKSYYALKCATDQYKA